MRRTAAATAVLALVGECAGSRPITLLDRHGSLGIQSPKDLLLAPDRFVGVGTNAPEELLDVDGDMSISGGLRLGTRAPGQELQPVRACDATSEGLLSAPSNVASHDRDLRTFFMCKDGEWIPVGEVHKQAPTLSSCKDHPHWGVQDEFEMFVINPDSGAPEKVDCHSNDHVTQRPYIVLEGDAEMTLQVGDTYVEAGARVFDDDARRVELENAFVQMSTAPVDTSTPGTYYIQYSTSDSTSHAAFPVVRTITVVDPSPPPEPDNVGLSCRDIKNRQPNSQDGVYWIDPTNSGTPFRVSCDMTRDGGGWIRIKLSNRFSDELEFSRTFDNFRVAMWQWLPDDPWKKCADNSVQYYRSTDGTVVTQSTILPIAENSVLPGDASRLRAMDRSYPIGYADPDPTIGERNWVEINAIRSVITELHPMTRIVATVRHESTSPFSLLTVYFDHHLCMNTDAHMTAVFGCSSRRMTTRTVC